VPGTKQLQVRGEPILLRRTEAHPYRSSYAYSSSVPCPTVNENTKYFTFPRKWALIELARNLEIQKILRTELEEQIPAGEEATYDKLMNGLPYLDAFVCEILRLHPVQMTVIRQVCLSTPAHDFHIQ
jgi:Cytochrome P450